MKKLMLAIVVLCLGAFAMAQLGNPTTDVLGAHLNYGRGCAACHAPHGGAYGNGAAKGNDQTTVNSYLWGQDTTPLLGQTITFSGSTVEVLPSAMSATTPDVGGVLMCLSCHDGNLAKGAMMKNAVYETLPTTYGTFESVPTLLGNSGALGASSYLATHPVGLNAIYTCGGYNWTDCVNNSNGTVSMTGPLSSKFVQNYGFFVSFGNNGGNAVVVCTTCHNQHSMNAVKVTSSKSGLTPGVYQTMFFIRAPYNPASGTAGSNQTAQFCRQCHGGESNEAAGGMGVTTTF